LFLKIHVKIQIVISYVFACNKNKALQLQRVRAIAEYLHLKTNP